jgi:hypothetical protein
MEYESLGQLLRQAYEDFRRQGLREHPTEPAPSQNDFAKWLGVPNYNLSNWVTGARRPGAAYIDKLADKLGPRVYDSMGLNRKMPRDPKFRLLTDAFYTVGEDEQEHIVEVALKLADENKKEDKENNKSEFAYSG